MVAVDRARRYAHAPARAAHPRCPYVRLGCALSVSILVHLSLLGSAAPGAVRTAAPVPVRTLEARLERTSTSTGWPEAASAERRAIDGDPPPELPPPPPGRAGKPSDAEALDRAPRAAMVMDRRVPDAQGSTPAAVDPIYHSARELDVYPLPLAPLTAAYPSHLLNAQVAGNVLASVLVNEAGTVDRVDVLAGEPPGYFEEHARVTLASARFIPGRRDGKAVRSRVTVRVDFDPAAPAGAIR